MEEENKRIEETKSPKKSGIIVKILIVVAVLLIGIGCGLLISKGFDSEKDNKEINNNQEIDNNKGNKENENGNNGSNTNPDSPEKKDNDTPIFVNIKDELENTNGNIYIKGEDVKELYINNKLVLTADPAVQINFGDIYKAYDFYILFTYGSGTGSTRIYVYDTLGNLTQEIYELDDNKMIIADSDKYRDMSFIDNRIVTNATNLTDGPSLITKIDGNVTKDIYICNNEEISKANVADDFLVYAKYQLVFKEDGKFEISRINGSDIDKTFGEIKAENCQ